MCRGKNTCTELSDDPRLWDTFAPLRLPDWATDSIDRFTEAADTLLRGDREGCLIKLSTISNKEITEWYIEHGQMSGRHRNLILKKPITKDMPIELRDAIRSPRRLENEVFIRDGFRCRYCGCRLISKDFFVLFSRKLASSTFQRGKSNLDTHAIYHVAWPVADHVLPWKFGGKTDLSNLVSACASCNYGKDSYTIEQLGIENPFNRNPKLDSWDGLVSKISHLKQV